MRKERSAVDARRLDHARRVATSRPPLANRDDQYESAT
jgi:hypothetical protein